ncbi:MAG: hypothetical protein ACK5VI_10195 [Opitutia bacterium]
MDDLIEQLRAFDITDPDPLLAGRAADRILELEAEAESLRIRIANNAARYQELETTAVNLAGRIAGVSVVRDEHGVTFLERPALAGDAELLTEDPDHA